MGRFASRTFNQKAKMRILHISTRIDGSGGLQRSISVRLNYLAQKGYDVHLLTTNSENQKVYFPLYKKINHLDKQNVSSFFAYKKLIQRTFDQVQPDLVVVSDNGLKGFLIPFFLPSTTKIIYELHATKEQIINDTNKFLKAIGVSKYFINFSTKRFSDFVVLSEEESKKWNPANLKIIPNPLTLADAKESSLDHKKVIFVGRLKLVKGIDFLLEIWAKVVQKHPDWILEIYGEKFPEFDVQKAIKEKGLQGSVFVFEPTSEIHQKYAEASLFLMTSRSESFGLVLTEAMYCGLPCIAFDAPSGPSSIIENEKNGFLIPCFNLELFSEKVIKLIENELLRKQMGKNAMESVRRFELEKIMKRWEELFKRTN